jgi:GH25 family lysozyme M1 (1,4-beta-N-acetylmuramidase)
VLQGVDTSTFQSAVDETLMRKHGVDFRILKLGEGGDFIDATNGSAKDTDGQKIARLHAQVAAIRAAGMIPGGYHYLRVRKDRTGAHEMTFALKLYREAGLGRPGDLRLAIDIENREDLAKHGAAHVVKYLVSAIRQYRTVKGHYPILYSFPSYLNEVLRAASADQLDAIVRCPLWIAHFGAVTPSIPAPFKQSAIWQKSETASVGGESPVDFNVADERRFVAARVPWVKVQPPVAKPDEPADDEATRRIQINCNRFTDKWLLNVTPLIVDGIKGPATTKRIMAIKWYLGYGKDRTGKVTREFVRRMRHPRDVRYSSPRMIATGIRRRRRQKRAERAVLKSIPGFEGAVLFDGKPTPGWMVPWIEKIRARGRWKGGVVSGIRTPAHSISLCFGICGRPFCPGLCAGASSNHNATAPVVMCEGAIDVSDFFTFAQEARAVGAPFKNDLPNDRVHFSCTGH